MRNALRKHGFEELALPGLAGCFLLMPGGMRMGDSLERRPPACLVGE